MSWLATEWSAPRILGSPPADYLGPIYFRTFNRDILPGKKDLTGFTKFKPRKIAGIDVATRFSHFGSTLMAKIKHPEMFDQEGQLEAAWSEPIVATKKANFPKNWDQYGSGFLQIISARTKKAIEAVELGVHLFIPLVIKGENGEDDLPTYVFKCGSGGELNLLRALDEWQDHEDVIVGPKDRQSPDVFLLFDPDKIHGMHLFWCELGPVFSERMVQSLGDILPPGVFFVPAGVRQ